MRFIFMQKLVPIKVVVKIPFELLVPLRRFLANKLYLQQLYSRAYDSPKIQYLLRLPGPLSQLIILFLKQFIPSDINVRNCL